MYIHFHYLIYEPPIKKGPVLEWIRLRFIEYGCSRQQERTKPIWQINKINKNYTENE